jgi:secreted trypsin-like serine protease
VVPRHRCVGGLLLALVLLLASAGGAAARPLPRIVGGTSASTGTWPWAAFVSVEPGDGTLYRCSATVVAPNVVLTAAHCVIDASTMAAYPLSGFRVTTASLDSGAAGAQVSGVSATELPGGFSTDTLPDGSVSSDHDLALLVLSTATSAPAVALAGSPADASPGTAAQVAGWGLTSRSAADEPAQLQWAPTVVQSPSWCAEQDAAELGASFDGADQLCAIDAPTDDSAICFGDSGGPLVTEVGGVPTEIGLTDYGTCSTSAPSVFTSIAAYDTWITAELAELQASASSVGATTPTAPAEESPVTSPLATTPAPAAASAVSVGARAALRSGTYRGRTARGRSISLGLNRSKRLDDLHLSFALRCARRTLTRSVTLLAHGGSWPLNADAGVGLARSFGDPAGAQVTLDARFSAHGTVSGTLKATQRIRGLGACSSGLLRWSASWD